MLLSLAPKTIWKQKKKGEKRKGKEKRKRERENVKKAIP
jgi:hypothetical protein